MLRVGFLNVRKPFIAQTQSTSHIGSISICEPLGSYAETYLFAFLFHRHLFYGKTEYCLQNLLYFTCVNKTTPLCLLY